MSFNRESNTQLTLEYDGTKPLHAMNENALFSQNKQQHLHGSNAKLSSSQSQSAKKRGLGLALSHNKENASTYNKEGLISLHFNSKSEMIVQPFSNTNPIQSNKFSNSNNKNVSSMTKTLERNEHKSTDSIISIELSPGWSPPALNSADSSSRMEEDSQYMNSSSIARSELQEVVCNLNLIDLAQVEDDTPLSYGNINNHNNINNNNNNKDDSTGFMEDTTNIFNRGDSSTTSSQFLREISNNILNKQNSFCSFNEAVSFDKKQKFYKKANFDRFIPSRVETDTYKFFLSSDDSCSKSLSSQDNSQQQQFDQFGNPIDNRSNNAPLSSLQSSHASLANSNNNMRDEYNRQLYHNLLQAHFLENNTNHSSIATGAFSGDDSSLFSSNFSESAPNNLKQKSYKPLKKLFSYGDNSSSQSSSSIFTSASHCTSSSSLITSSFSSSKYVDTILNSNKKGSMANSLINIPDSNNYTRDDTPKLKVNPRPYKILEAPTLKNDFYLNLLDWSPSNLVSVGLENYVYILSGANQSVKTQFTIPEYIDPNILQMHQDHQDNTHLSDYYNMVCSVGWSQRSDHIAVGDRQGKVYLFDLAKNKFLRVMHNHKGRVGQIAWNGHLIATGSRDKNILITDIRDKNPHSIVFKGHEQEICGMRWSFDEQTLASGGNDNKVFLWSLKMNGKLAKISQSKAAVKAIGFSPHQHNILAFGGGTADRCIRIYDTQQLKQIDCIDTGSQVCNLIFSKNSRQIISTHGYSLNQIIVWNQSNMKKIATLTGHSQRVLYLAESPCGQNILTGAADETIRFWNIFKNDIVNELSPSSLGLR